MYSNYIFWGCGNNRYPIVKLFKKKKKKVPGPFPYPQFPEFWGYLLYSIPTYLPLISLTWAVADLSLSFGISLSLVDTQSQILIGLTIIHAFELLEAFITPLLVKYQCLLQSHMLFGNVSYKGRWIWYLMILLKCMQLVLFVPDLKPSYHSR